MSRPRCYKYAKNFQAARSSYEKAYFSDNYKVFVKYALVAMEDFCVFFIYFSLPDKPDLAKAIIKGKADFQGPLQEPIKLKPDGKQLLKYIFQSPKSNLLADLKSQFVYSLYDELSELSGIINTTDELRFIAVKNKLQTLSSLFDDIFIDVGNLDAKLENALDNCRRVTSAGYKKAKEQIQGIYSSIAIISKYIDSHSLQIASQNLVDPTLQNQLRDQLHSVHEAFIGEADKASNDIEEKRKATDSFNITLFGRTNVGKSTLMEILTNGRGSAIGHGAQRTTKDVRSYKWKGLSVTDVPGIDAYDGLVDEALADHASRFADEIIFMITAGQPESIEAKWLVKLKRMDKPMLCLCNVKRTVEDEKNLNKFLDAPEKILDKEGVQQAIDQFAQFVKQDLPNEDIKLIVTHLRSRFLANQKGYEKYRDNLIEASRFPTVENAIIKDVITNGILYRKKCYLSILDVPVYDQMCSLLDFSATNLHSYELIEEAEKSFYQWSNSFSIQEKHSLLSKVESTFVKIERSISSFVDDNIELSDFGERWNRFISGERIDSKINTAFRSSFNKARNHIENTFKDIKTELSLSSSQYSYTLMGGKVGDYGKAFGLTSGGCGLIGAILFCIPGAQTVAIVFSVASVVTGLISMIWTSREKRLRKKKLEKIEELTNLVEKQKQDQLSSIGKAFDEQITLGVIEEAKGRFSVIKHTLLALANSQRSMALSYLNNHLDISARMIRNVLEDMGLGRIKIDRVARVPGKKTIIISSNKILKDKEILYNISRRLGNNEEIRCCSINQSMSLATQFKAISEFLGLPISSPLFNNINYMERSHTIAYCKPFNTIAKEADNILLLEQILGIQVIFKV